MIAFLEEEIMKKNRVTLVLVVTALFLAGAAFAEIRVVSVKGTAAYKTAGQWTPLQAGTVLAVGTKVSTGVRSNVVINVNKHTVTVYPLTIMKISDSVETNTSSSTKIGLRRGAVRTKIARNARIKTVFKVSTPVATSSVRGSEQLSISGPSLGSKFFVLGGSFQGSGLNSGPQLLFDKLQLWQKAHKGSSESSMSGLEEFLTQTHSLFITVDEETAFQLFGDDFSNYQPGTRGTTQNQNLMVPVSIYLVWPTLP
jgi:hypothetical protein